MGEVYTLQLGCYFFHRSMEASSHAALDIRPQMHACPSGQHSALGWLPSTDLIYIVYIEVSLREIGACGGRSRKESSYSKTQIQ